MNAEELLNELKARGTEMTHPIDREIFIKYSLACISENTEPRIGEIWGTRDDMDERQYELEIAYEWIRDAIRLYRKSLI